MKLGDYVKDYRARCGLSQRDFAKLTGLSAGYVSMLENGRNPATGKPLKLSFDTYKRIAGATGRTMDELFAIVDDRVAVSDADAPISQAALRVAELYNVADERDQRLVDTILQPYAALVPAQTPEQKTLIFASAATRHMRRGKPMDQLDVFDEPAAAGLGNYLGTPVFRKEQYPHGMIPRGTSFGVLISGDSMEPKIHNGATCFVQSVPRVENGEIGIFVLNGESFCKQLVLKDGQVRLHSFNSAYKDIVIRESDDLRTVGRVLGSYPE